MTCFVCACVCVCLIDRFIMVYVSFLLMNGCIRLVGNIVGPRMLVGGCFAVLKAVEKQYVRMSA